MTLGIDFGTCFSLPAVFYEGHTYLLLPHGVYGIPSLFTSVAETRTDGGVTGHKKYVGLMVDQERQRGSIKEFCSAIKMDLLTTNYDDLYRDAPFEQKSSLTIIELGGKQYTSKEIISDIIEDVIQTAVLWAERKFLSKPVLEGIVITVPAEFTHNEKAVIMEAAQFCKSVKAYNIKKISLIKEPLAAAICYFMNNDLPPGTNILVYDLGGGTCDVAVVCRSQVGSKEKYRVKASGMKRVGGNNWDEKLYEIIKNNLMKQESWRLLRDDASRVAINEEHIIEIKHRLSIEDKVRPRITFAGSETYWPTVTRSEFDEATKGLLNTTIGLVKTVYDNFKENNKNEKIDYIICTGGGSRMPQVLNAMKGLFKDELVNILRYEPDTAISSGAAIYADMVSNTNDYDTEGSIEDTPDYSYGIELDLDPENPRNYRRNVLNFIKKREKSHRLPVRRSARVHTSIKGIDHSYFEIYESEFIVNEYNRRDGGKVIGYLHINHSDVKADESADTEIEMALSRSGLLEISAVDPVTKERAHIEIQKNF